MFTNFSSSLTSVASKTAVLIPLSLAFWAAPHGAQAQGAAGEMATVEQREAALHNRSALCKGGVDASSIGRQVLGFFNTGGYVLTGNGKSDALFGSPKFYNDVTIYARPKHIGALELSAGAETLTLSDHFVPFTGGNEYDLLGGSIMVSTPRGAGKLRAYVNGGLFYGRLRSVNQGFDRSAFIPSGSVGVEYPLNTNFSLEASYRVSQNINGVSTDGFSFSLKIH
jgi:hypothetical protein